MTLSPAEFRERLALEERRINALLVQRWKAADLSYKLHTGQRVIHQTLEDLRTTPEALIFCARQWGKTYLMLCYAIMECIRRPGIIVRYAAPTLKQCGDIVADNLEPILRDAPGSLVRRVKSDYRWFIGRSQLRIGSMRRSEIDTLRGGNASLIVAEEGGFVDSQDYAYAMASVFGPQLLHSKGRIMHVTTPSEEPEHYIHTEVLPRCELTGTLFRFDIHTNPRITLEQMTHLARLLGGMDTMAWKREALVQIVRDPSRVPVPEWKEETMYREFDTPKHAMWSITGDVGGVTDKTVMQCHAWDFRNNRLLILDERVYPNNTGSEIIAQGWRKMYEEFSSQIHNPMMQTHLDAHGQTIVDLRKLGIEATLPLKDDWEAALNAFRYQVGQGKVWVHKRCAFTNQTLKSATFNKQRTDYARTELLGHMDALACATYANRMQDRITNPYPGVILDIENKMYTPATYQQATKSKQVANALIGKRGRA
jgi:hypothetical protein